MDQQSSHTHRADREHPKGLILTAPQARAVARWPGLAADAAALETLVGAGVITPSQARALSPGWRSPVTRRQRSRARRRRLSRPSIDARILGSVILTIAGAALVWATTALVSELLMPRPAPLAVELMDGLRLLASLLAFVGGRRMFRGARSGKVLVLLGVAAYAAVTVAVNMGRSSLSDPATAVPLAACVVLYYLAATSDLLPQPPRS
jgi:hypothetical protein